MNRDASNLKLIRSSEASCSGMAYKVKMRKLFNLQNDWLLQWGFPDGRGLVKSDYLILFKKVTCFIYDYQTYIQEIIFAHVHEIN